MSRPARLLVDLGTAPSELRTADGPPPVPPSLHERIESGLRLREGAKRKRALAPKMAKEWGDPTGARFGRREADQLEAEAAALLALPPEYREPALGGELLPAQPFEMVPTNRGNLQDYIRDTVSAADADMAMAGASQKRLELVAEAGALLLAADAAESIVSPDSFSKMLAHQLAVIHNATMRIGARMSRHLDSVETNFNNPVQAKAHGEEAVRLMNAMARGTDSFARGTLALKAYLGGTKQEVRVTHVHQQVQVNEGGQAVVAGGDAKAGKRGPGGGRKPRAEESK